MQGSKLFCFCLSVTMKSTGACRFCAFDFWSTCCPAVSCFRTRPTTTTDRVPQRNAKSPTTKPPSKSDLASLALCIAGLHHRRHQDLPLEFHNVARLCDLYGSPPKIQNLPLRSLHLAGDLESIEHQIARSSQPLHTLRRQRNKPPCKGTLMFAYSSTGHHEYTGMS